MNDSRLYDRWRGRRSDVEVHSGFADRLMDEIHRAECRRSTGGLAGGGGRSPISHRFLAAALVIVGVVVGILRVGSVIAFVLFTSSEGF